MKRKHFTLCALLLVLASLCYLPITLTKNLFILQTTISLLVIISLVILGVFIYKNFRNKEDPEQSELAFDEECLLIQEIDHEDDLAYEFRELTPSDSDTKQFREPFSVIRQ